MISFLCKLFILNDVFDLVLAKVTSTFAHLINLRKVAKANLLGHATYHIFLLRHLNIKSLLLHPHCLVLENLLIGVHESFKDFSLDAGEAIARGAHTIPHLLHLSLLKLSIHVLLDMSSILLECFNFLFNVVNFLEKKGFVD